MAFFDETLHGRDDELDDYGEGSAYDDNAEEEEDYDEEEEEEEEAGAIEKGPRESVEPVAPGGMKEAMVEAPAGEKPARKAPSRKPAAKKAAPK